MFQGLVKAALPTAAAAAFMALAATPSPAFTLSAPSLDKPTATSNIEEAYWVGGWGWRRPWGYRWGEVVPLERRHLSDRPEVRSISRPLEPRWRKSRGLFVERT